MSTDPSVAGQRIFDPADDHTAANAQPFDMSLLKFDTAENITESLERVARAVADRTITPAMGKSIATIAGTSLRSIGLSVAAQIKELKALFDARDAEAKGAGRRTGVR